MRSVNCVQRVISRAHRLKILAMACLLVALAVDAMAAPNCPNMPTGSTIILDCAFNSVNCLGEAGGPLWELYPGAASITQPGGNPASAPNADTSTLPAGASVGGQQTIWPNPGNQQPLTNLYMCLPFQMAPGFVGQQTANKLFFMHTKDWPFGSYTNNGFFGLQGNGYPPSNFYLYFGHNTGAHDGLPGLDNSHICAQDSGLVCGPNAATTLMTAGNWYTLEVYMVSGTCITCRNTVIKWWVNGALNGNYTNLNYTDGIINQWQLNHTWDGGSAVQCGPPTNPSNTIGRDCRVDQKYHFDHVILASVGGVSPGTGGSGGTPPPPPSPTPTPPPPTGVPGNVTDLTAIALSATSVQLSFTGVDDGTGSPAKYDVRQAQSPINWGAASSVTHGTCSTPLAPNIIGPVTCNITGLSPGTAYQFQLVPYRGTLNAGATFATSLSSIASATTPFLPVPSISSFSPLSGPVGTSVVLTGSAFAPTIGNNTVKLNGQAVTVTAASETSITITIPGGATTGRFSVQTSTGTGFSDQNFVVTVPDPVVLPNSCGCS